MPLQFDFRLEFVSGYQEANDCGSGEPVDHQWAQDKQGSLWLMVCERCGSWAIFRAVVGPTYEVA